MSLIQKYSYTSPKGDKYKMTVTQEPTVVTTYKTSPAKTIGNEVIPASKYKIEKTIMKTTRTLTKNGETMSPSKLPSPVRRALMQNVLRRSSSGEGGKTGLEGVPTHVLAVIAKELSIFQVIKQLCSSSYSMLQNVCMNSTFWTHWLDNQSELSRKKKLLDWFFQTDPKIFTINKETLKYISVFFVKHPKGLTSIPFKDLLAEYDKKNWLRPLEKNKEFTKNLENNYIFKLLDLLAYELNLLQPLDKLLIELYGIPEKATILEDEGAEYLLVSIQSIIFNPKPEIKFPMTYLFLHGKPEYFLNDSTISTTDLLNINLDFNRITYDDKAYASVNQSKKLSFQDFILNHNELSKVKIDIKYLIRLPVPRKSYLKTHFK